MPTTRSLHLIDFDDEQISEIRSHHKSLIATDAPMERPYIDLLADVTVCIVRLEEDAKALLGMAMAITEDQVYPGIYEGRRITEPCGLLYVTGYLQHLITNPRHQAKLPAVQELMNLAARYPMALLLTDGTGLNKTIGKLMDGGRDYLRSLTSEQIAATGTGR